jgi:hypothetical protein
MIVNPLLDSLPPEVVRDASCEEEHCLCEAGSTEGFVVGVELADAHPETISTGNPSVTTLPQS